MSALKPSAVTRLWVKWSIDQDVDPVRRADLAFALIDEFHPGRAYRDLQIGMLKFQVAEAILARRKHGFPVRSADKGAALLRDLLRHASRDERLLQGLLSIIIIPVQGNDVRIVPVTTFREKVQQIIPALLLIDKLIFILLAPVCRVLLPAPVKLPAAPVRKVILTFSATLPARS